MPLLCIFRPRLPHNLIVESVFLFFSTSSLPIRGSFHVILFRTLFLLQLLCTHKHPLLSIYFSLLLIPLQEIIIIYFCVALLDRHTLIYARPFSLYLFSLLPALCFLVLLLLPWITIEEWFNQGECPALSLSTPHTSALLLLLTSIPPLLLFLPLSCRVELDVVLGVPQKTPRKFQGLQKVVFSIPFTIPCHS